MRVRLLSLFSALLCSFTAFAACGGPPERPLTHIQLPAHPFSVVESADACWLFITMSGVQNPPHAIAVFQRKGGRFLNKREVPVPGNPFDMAISHDGKLLIVVAIDSVSFLDAQALATGRGPFVVGTMRYGPDTAQPIYANFSPDDRFAFVSDEHAQRVTVIDMAKARSTHFSASAIVGTIPTGYAPIALTFSPDGKLLYNTSEVGDPSWKWPARCKQEGKTSEELTRPEGAIEVIDVAKAETDPANAVLARVPAGCSPVRLAITPDGSTVWLTARNSNAVMAFDTAKLLSDAEHARVASVSVGTAPVGIAVFDGGKRVIATNSNRFGQPTENQVLNVIDAEAALAGKAAILGTIEAGAFPREISLSRDGKILFVSNWMSNTVQVLDVARLPLRK
ncbi:MAG TPA: beta-propeller fold lactonase family protein [Terriglobales bacterium]|nr:beta-propeller fold lactonase family protein [Terriglobales bacterium]